MGLAYESKGSPYSPFSANPNSNGYTYQYGAPAGQAFLRSNMAWGLVQLSAFVEQSNLAQWYRWEKANNGQRFNV